MVFRTGSQRARPGVALRGAGSRRGYCGRRRAAASLPGRRASSPGSASPGGRGQASPHPMVTTTSDARTASSVRGLGNSLVMSSPTSAMASTTSGFTMSAGALPAERTTTLPLARSSSRAAAIWERPALSTQTNSTSGRSVISGPHVSSPGRAGIGLLHGRAVRFRGRGARRHRRPPRPRTGIGTARRRWPGGRRRPAPPRTPGRRRGRYPRRCR